MYTRYLIVFICFPLFMTAQGGMIIESGVNVVMDNSPQLVIQNGYFKNDGDFTAGNSSVIMTGDASTPNSTIGGASVTPFYHLEINKSSHDVRLDYDILVDGDIKMNGGQFILNYSDVVLGGDILNESETNRITGTSGGAIIKTVNLDMPTNKNPGNLGAEITSTSNLGNTTIRRSHVQLDNDGNYSIHRQYSISTEHPNANATLRLHYFDAELAGLNENDLESWQFDDIGWLSFGVTNSDMVANWIEANGFGDLYTHTLAVDMEGALPVELLSFDAYLREER